MPAPGRQFSRPSIDLSSAGKRDWAEVEAQTLTKGDTVRGMGLIEWVDWDENGVVSIRWKNGTTSLWDQFDKVTAFVEV